MRSALSSVAVQGVCTHVRKSAGSLCWLLSLAAVKSVVICILPLTGFPVAVQRQPVLKPCRQAAHPRWAGVVAPCQHGHPPLPRRARRYPTRDTSPPRCTWVRPRLFRLSTLAARTAWFLWVLGGTGCFRSRFILTDWHLLVRHVFWLFLMSWVFAASSLAAPRQLRGSFCSCKLGSFSLQLVPCRVPELCRASSRRPASPGPCARPVTHLKVGAPHQGEPLPCPSLCGAYSRRASKEQQGLQGEILRAVRAARQGTEGVPAVPPVN